MIGKIVITDVEDVIKECEQLLELFRKEYEYDMRCGNNYGCTNINGRVFAIVMLLVRITDKSAEDYYKEIFPENYKEIFPENYKEIFPEKYVDDIDVSMVSGRTVMNRYNNRYLDG